MVIIRIGYKWTTTRIHAFIQRPAGGTVRSRSPEQGSSIIYNNNISIVWQSNFLKATQFRGLGFQVWGLVISEFYILGL